MSDVTGSWRRVETMRDNQRDVTRWQLMKTIRQLHKFICSDTQLTLVGSTRETSDANDVTSPEGVVDLMKVLRIRPLIQTCKDLHSCFILLNVVEH